MTMYCEMIHSVSSVDLPKRNPCWGSLSKPSRFGNGRSWSDITITRTFEIFHGERGVFWLTEERTRRNNMGLTVKHTSLGRWMEYRPDREVWQHSHCEELGRRNSLVGNMRRRKYIGLTEYWEVDPIHEGKPQPYQEGPRPNKLRMGGKLDSSAWKKPSLK